MYQIIYDGNCNLCVTFVRLLERIDSGRKFAYAPMQDAEALARWGISAEDCALGVILLDRDAPERRWQGSDAMEEVGRLLPGGRAVVDLYRALPGVKPVGDFVYAEVRDRRYELFGKRTETYCANCAKEKDREIDN